MEWLKDARPELVERYRELYRRGAYAPPQERERLAGLVRRRGRAPRSGSADTKRRTLAREGPVISELQPSLF